MSGPSRPRGRDSDEIRRLRAALEEARAPFAQLSDTQLAIADADGLSVWGRELLLVIYHFFAGRDPDVEQMEQFRGVLQGLVDQVDDAIREKEAAEESSD